MPWLPGHQLLAVDFDQCRLFARSNGNDAFEIVGVGAVDRGYRMILERPEDLADFHLHFGGRIDSLEDNHPAIFEQLVKPGADIRVLEQSAGNASHPRAEGQAVTERVNFEACHVILLMWPFGLRHFAGILDGLGGIAQGALPPATQTCSICACQSPRIDLCTRVDIDRDL